MILRRLFARERSRIAEFKRGVASGAFEDIESACLRLLESGPNVMGYQYLGFAAYQAQRYKLAVEACSTARDMGLNEWPNYLALGISLGYLDRPEDAITALKAAYELAPDNADVAGALLKQTIIVAGVVAAEGLYHRMAAIIPIRLWLKLVFEYGDNTYVMPAGYIKCEQALASGWAHDHGLTIISVGNIDEIPIESPRVVGRPPLEPFKTTISSLAHYVAELHDVTIFSRSNIILTGDKMALNEAGAHKEYGRFVSHQADGAVVGQRGNSLLLDVGSYEIGILEAGIMMSGAASNAFGHWVPEYLPKLEFLAHHPDFKNLPIIVDQDMPQSHYDYMRCIADNPLVKLKSGTGLTCKRLIYAPPPTFFPIHLLPNDIPPYGVGPIAPATYRFLKEKIEAAFPRKSPPSEKYFLSRRNTTWRKLANDAQIAEFLEKKGFKTIQVEDLSFAQQVRLFQDATHIVASNGSALQNIIFSDTAVRLLVLTQSNLANWSAYNAQTGALGYRPLFVCGESIGRSEQKHADYIIPLDTLETALALAQ